MVPACILGTFDLPLMYLFAIGKSVLTRLEEMFLKYDIAKNAKQRGKDVSCKHNQMAGKVNFKAKLRGKAKGLEYLEHLKR